MNPNAAGITINGMSEAPLVSIVIPCYNHGHFLPEAVESALSQTYQRIEVVVVDDGSRDNTAEVVARYRDVRCVRQENRGLAGARNAGFHASRGEYVLFLDADDRLTPTAIEGHLSCFAKHPEAGFVVGDIDHISLDGSYARSPRWPVLEANQYEELLKVNHVANTIAVMFRRSVIERVGGFKPFCSPAEDYELLLHAARLFPSAHHRTVVAQYRRHTTSLSRKGALMLRAVHRVMCLQRDAVEEDPRLLKAHREGGLYWRDHFAGATIREVCAHLGRCEPWRAALAFAALLRYVRGRLFVLPWKHRQRVVTAIRHLFGIPQKRVDRRPSSIG
jgi:glycosyltransferase involved in cell wall biosynthesis